MVENSRSRSLHAAEIRFVAGILRDAEKLDWKEGQLEKRKLSINMVMTGPVADTWDEEATLFGLTGTEEANDERFKEHGWNKVDSGFRLWGAGKIDDSTRSSRDVFLRSKGWNTVNSGFRIF
jgi:hypothetical protein